MKRFRTGQEYEGDSINMANVLVLLSRGSGGAAASDEADLIVGGPKQYSGARVFECKTCNRQFPSFQALGGHRASHKKLRQEAAGPPHSPPVPAPPAKPRMHECSVCGLEFAIGQALGGHMRRHRAALEGGLVPHRHSLAEKKSTGAGGDAPGGGCGGGKKRPGGVLCFDLDLNLPASENDKEFLSLNFGVGLPMVDCFH